MEAKHTATPWGGIVEIDAFNLGIDYPDGDERDHFLCRLTCGDPDELRANAEFIVRACNAYDDLVKALQAFDAGINPRARRELDDMTARNPGCTEASFAVPVTPAVWEMIRAALDKAGA